MVEEIMCDADLFHIGTEDFKQTNKLMRKELNKVGEEFSKKQWKKKINFLESHRYFTSYAGKNYSRYRMKTFNDERIKG